MFKKENIGKTNINHLKKVKILVFLFILFIIISIMIFLIIFSKIRIEIINFNFNSMKPRHINNNYKILINFYTFDKIPIFKIRITKLILDKLKLKYKEKIRNVEMKLLSNTSKINKKKINAMKKLDIIIKKIDLDIELGTENAGVTAMIIPLVSTIISIVLKNKVSNYKEQFFKISPVYINQNLINIRVSGIFEIKMIHIINIIYVLSKKEGVKKNERASDRRPYDYSYE